MAVDLHGREQLLPSELLNDDDIFSENRTIITHDVSSTESISNGFGFSGSSSSGLSSPFGSELCSTETKSDEDEDDHDFIAELIRQMADYTLEEDDENAGGNCGSENLKYPFGLPGSSQYTISGSEYNLGSTEHHGERLDTTSVAAHDSGDQTQTLLLYKLENQPSANNQSYDCWATREKKTEFTQLPEQKQQLQHRKPPHHMQNRGGRADAASVGGFVSPATAWPPLQQVRQQQNQQVGSGSGMRAVFLGGPGSRSGSCGTGVFLPRGTDNASEVRKKAGCSTVLIPARVMQALQLHFEGVNTRPKSNAQPLQQDAAAATSRSSDSDVNPRRKRRGRQRKRPAVNHHDIHLPQEWTY